MIIYPVKDLAKAKVLFIKLLGVNPNTDEPYYVGFRIGDQDIGLDPNGFKPGMTMPLAFYHVDDIKKSLQLRLDGGAQTLSPTRERSPYVVIAPSIHIYSGGLTRCSIL